MHNPETIKSYQDLIAWQKAIKLVTEIYNLTDTFPKQEMYGLTNQMRRASVSIPSNIAEGSSRKSTLEFIRFLKIAQGSLAELETQIIIAKNLKYISIEDEKYVCSQTNEVGRIIQGLINSLDSRLYTQDSKQAF